MKGGGRPAFTLMEVLVAASIGTALMVMVVQAYLGMGKSQAMVTLGMNLKNCGTASIEDMHRSLRAARLLLPRPSPVNDPTHVTNQWLSRVPVAGLHTGGAVVAPLTYSTSPNELTPGPFRGDGSRPDEFVLPEFQPTATFYDQDVNGQVNPDFSAGKVGNALAFFQNEGKVSFKMNLANAGDDPAVVLANYGGSIVQRFSAYRLVVYYVARRPLPAGVVLRQANVADEAYSYVLMQWKSRPMVDRREIERWMQRVENEWATLDPKLADGGNGAVLYVWSKMLDLKNQGMVGAVDPTSQAPGKAEVPNALGSLLASKGMSGTDPLAPTDEVSDFLTGDFRTALRMLPKDSNGEGMLAFNTLDSGPYAAVAMGGLRVPSFGGLTGVPFGFETAVGGLRTNRQVLLRLNLAARTLTKRDYVGQMYQQVVSVAED